MVQQARLELIDAVGAGALLGRIHAGPVSNAAYRLSIVVEPFTLLQSSPMALILQILPCGDDGSAGWLLRFLSEPSVLNPNNTQAGGRLVRRCQKCQRADLAGKKATKIVFD